MALKVILSRSMSGLATVLVLCGCAAGQSTNADPCVKVKADEKAISRQNVDQVTLGTALAQHVVANPACYDSALVAQARTALVQIDQAKSLPTPTWAQNWFERNQH